MFLPNLYLLLCSIMLFLATAFVDDAFNAVNLCTPDDLYRVKVPEGLKAIAIPFKSCIADVLIFRLDKS